MPEFKDETSQESELINREILRQAMSKLSDEHREVVTLHEIDGFTYEEIAQITNIPVGTVKSRLFHAFTNLRKAIYTPEEVH